MNVLKGDDSMRYHDIEIKKLLKSLIFVAISAVLQSFVIQTFVRQAGLLSGGFTGLSILIERITDLVGLNISVSFVLVCLNIPVALLSYRHISSKFTILSLIQVLLMSFLLQFVNYNVALFDELFLNVIFGGVLNGVAVLFALRGNASTGGMDFISLYVSNKTGKSIWNYVFIGNCVLLVIFGFIFGWDYAGYSIIFQYCSTNIISAFHQRYDQVTLQITTKHAKEVIDIYVKTFRHGISCVDAIGGYSGQKMYVLHTVISSYEEQDVVNCIRNIDSKVIINVFKTINFYGGFYRPPLD